MKLGCWTNHCKPWALPKAAFAAGRYPHPRRQSPQRLITSIDHRNLPRPVSPICKRSPSAAVRQCLPVNTALRRVGPRRFQKKPACWRVSSYRSGRCGCPLVPKRGLEPLRLSSLPPQGSASTNSATWAGVLLLQPLFRALLRVSAGALAVLRPGSGLARSSLRVRCSSAWWPAAPPRWRASCWPPQPPAFPIPRP